MESKLSRKEATHVRIVEAAARAIRRGGYSGVGVADIMKEAGLTHGGFYAHFPSRDTMLAEALNYASLHTAKARAAKAAQVYPQGISPIRSLIQSYLSEQHLKSLESGCPVAALVSDMPRQSPQVQAASRASVQHLLAAAQSALPATANPDAAMILTSTMIGALQLARALGNNAQGKALLAANRNALIMQYDT